MKDKTDGFAKYWEDNNELFEQLNVTKAVAKKIWSDCVDAITSKIIDHYISKI